MKSGLVTYNMIRGENEYNGIFLLFQDRKHRKEDSRRRIPAAGFRNNLAVRGNIDLLKMAQYLIIVIVSADDPDIVGIKYRRKSFNCVLDK